ncbi:flagellar protein FlaG [Niveibacterium sp. SC-1]|uniref:flagellar protein FlaG n=1 Tax=Niveibacterium sp. SC-1 TaxID=3135646 RepID=UPI00311F1B40
MSIPAITNGLAPPAASGGNRPAAETIPSSSTQAAAPTLTPQAVEATQAAAQSGSSRLQPEQVKQAVDALKEAFKSVAQDLQFSIDEDTGKTVVKIVDAVTKDVIRQIPGEEVLVIAKALGKLDKLHGVLVKQQA